MQRQIYFQIIEMSFLYQVQVFIGCESLWATKIYRIVMWAKFIGRFLFLFTLNFAISQCSRISGTSKSWRNAAYFRRIINTKKTFLKKLWKNRNLPKNTSVCSVKLDAAEGIVIRWLKRCWQSPWITLLTVISDKICSMLSWNCLELFIKYSVKLWNRRNGNFVNDDNNGL